MTFLCSSNCSTLRKLQSKTCCASLLSRHFSYARYTPTTPSLPPSAFFRLLLNFNISTALFILSPYSKQQKHFHFLFDRTNSGANIYNLYNTESYAHAPTHVHSLDCTLRKLVDLHSLHNLEKLSWPFGSVCPHHPPPCSFPCD